MLVEWILLRTMAMLRGLLVSRLNLSASAIQFRWEARWKGSWGTSVLSLTKLHRLRRRLSFCLLKSSPVLGEMRKMVKYLTGFRLPTTRKTPSVTHGIALVKAGSGRRRMRTFNGYIRCTQCFVIGGNCPFNVLTAGPLNIRTVSLYLD
jgi:hypothetical protein